MIKSRHQPMNYSSPAPQNWKSILSIHHKHAENAGFAYAAGIKHKNYCCETQRASKRTLKINQVMS